MHKTNLKKKPVIIGIIMTYNCGFMLKDICPKIPKAVFNKLIVVDDESTDNTVKIAKSLNLQVFVHKHLGYGGNIKYGLKKAAELGADYMVEIHGDGQYNPQFIPDGLKKMISGNYDFILGSRFSTLDQALKDGMPVERYLANRVLSFIDRMILQLPLAEFHSGFRIYSRKFVKKTGLKGTPNDHLYSFTAIVQAKYCKLNIGGFPVRCDYKKIHTSISIKESIFYAFQTRWLLLEYLLAKFNFKRKFFKYCRA